MSNFGEIAEPSSRAAWEDWDDCYNDNVSLSWTVDIDIPKNIDTFYILDGKYLVDYIQKRSSVQLERFDSILEDNLTVFRDIETDNYICLLKQYDLLKSSEIVELLKDFVIGSKNVVCVQSKPMAEYQVMSKTDIDCIIRSVSTTKSPTTAQPKLEQPNIIAGVTAGALSMREHLNMTGVCYICYIECTEDYDILALQKLLNQLGIKHKVKPAGDINTNLYI